MKKFIWLVDNLFDYTLYYMNVKVLVVLYKVIVTVVESNHKFAYHIINTWTSIYIYIHTYMYVYIPLLDITLRWRYTQCVNNAQAITGYSYNLIQLIHNISWYTSIVYVLCTYVHVTNTDGGCISLDMNPEMKGGVAWKITWLYYKWRHYYVFSLIVTVRHG